MTNFSDVYMIIFQYAQKISGQNFTVQHCTGVSSRAADTDDIQSQISIIFKTSLVLCAINDYFLSCIHRKVTSTISLFCTQV